MDLLFTWTGKEEKHVYGVTIACTTKEFYTASGIALSSWSLLKIISRPLSKRGANAISHTVGD